MFSEVINALEVVEQAIGPNLKPTPTNLQHGLLLRVKTMYENVVSD